MGLDFFDITVRIERAFHVQLSAEDIEGLVRSNDITVGDLYDLILTRMHLQDAGRHDLRLNRQFWSEMQQVLNTATNVAVDEITLPTRLEALFPRATRRDAWNALQGASPYRIRELDYPLAVRVGGALLAGCVVCLELFQIGQLPILKWIWPVLGLFGIWMFSETYLKILTVCAPWRNRFPGGVKTVKELCRSIRAANYADICRNAGISGVPLDDRSLEAWHTLVEIIADTLGVDPAEVTFRSRIMRDLGAA